MFCSCSYSVFLNSGFFFIKFSIYEAGDGERQQAIMRVRSTGIAQRRANSGSRMPRGTNSWMNPRHCPIRLGGVQAGCRSAALGQVSRAGGDWPSLVCAAPTLQRNLRLRRSYDRGDGALHRALRPLHTPIAPTLCASALLLFPEVPSFACFGLVVSSDNARGGDAHADSASTRPNRACGGLGSRVISYESIGIYQLQPNVRRS